MPATLLTHVVTTPRPGPASSLTAQRPVPVPRSPRPRPAGGCHPCQASSPPQPSAGCPHGLGHSFGRHLRFSLLRFIPVFLQV